jgi:hypothetical protein
MATRSIVTSQPDIACGFCGRRLLRGEQPEVFITGAERRTVCELCAPRAMHEGWLREVEGALPSNRPLRGRRGRTLLDRLRQRREPGAAGTGSAEQSGGAPDSEPYEFLGAPSFAAPSRPAAFLGESFGEQDAAAEPQAAHEELEHADWQPSGSLDRETQQAVRAFNASEQPRRIAGVARSLGHPEITVRASEQSAGRIWIVVAWELCWYRYEVDLDALPPGVSLAEQGMELDELPSEDRLANVAADERGELVALSS